MRHNSDVNKIWMRLLSLMIITLLAGNLVAQTNAAPVPVQEAANAAEKLDLHLTSKDRMFRGDIKILDSWVHVSLRFVNTTTGQVLGTYPDIMENLTASKPTVKIYNHKDDMFSDQDMQDAKNDPKVTEQKVVFYRDDSDPKLLHFSSIFDAVGIIQVQVLQGDKQVAYGETKLTTDAEFSSLIQTVDKTISGDGPPPIIDPTDPTDTTGHGDGLGLIVAEQPGSIDDPGQIDGKKNDPKGLVLPLHNGSSVPAASDADLCLITLRRPPGLHSNSGKITITVSSPSSVMIFNEEATHALTDYSVDLGNPKGDLAKLDSTNACVWIRGTAASPLVVLTYTYTDSSGKVQTTDKVQMSVGSSTSTR